MPLELHLVGRGSREGTVVCELPSDRILRVVVKNNPLQLLPQSGELLNMPGRDAFCQVDLGDPEVFI